MIQWLVGMNPFEALALLRMVGGYHNVWWRRAPLLGRGFSSSIVGAGGWVDQLIPHGSSASTWSKCWVGKILKVIKYCIDAFDAKC